MTLKSKIFTLLFLIVLGSSTYAQKPAYVLFNQEGKEVKYKKMVQTCAEADVVLFGELHNNPIAHWLQLELTQAIFAERGADLVMGAEMFESDGQLIMDEYFSGMITEKKFEDEMRLWNNYETDYKPLLEFAKENEVKFIATNIPRRYANVVFNLGLDTLTYLSDDAKAYMMPLPLEYDTELECYSALAKKDPMGRPGNPKLRDAQAVKDATMVHFLLKNYMEGKIFLHFQGAYHSDNFQSMTYFLKKAQPELNIVTISTVSQNEIEKLEDENLEKANFVIAVPERMTNTY